MEMPFVFKSIVYRASSVDLKIECQRQIYPFSLSREDLRSFSAFCSILKAETGIDMRSMIPESRITEFHNRWETLADTELEKIGRKN